MVQEIRARVLLSSVRQPDPWFGLRYSMNLYHGCQHQCIYCDSRSECCQIADFTDIQVKVNAPELLRKELASKRIKGTVGTGSMHDPYYEQLDRLFPGLRKQYVRRYGDRYSCRCPQAARLESVFHERCARHGLATRIPPYQPAAEIQLPLF